MAFKLDFDKLMNRTPEEVEATRVEVYERLEASILSKIQERRAKIEPLMQRIDMLPEKHARFVHDLDYKNTTFDRDGRQGGTLADLSDKQLSYLNSLHAQYVPAQIIGSSATVELLTLTETIARMKHEIIEDVKNGKIPVDCSSFSSLHDYVDANEYGGFCDDKLANAMIAHFGGRDENEGMPNAFMDYMNNSQNAIDDWVKRDGIKQGIAHAMDQTLLKEGSTTGKILRVEDGVVVQKKGRDGEEVRHDATRLSFVPEVDAVVNIKYGDDGKAAVTDVGRITGKEKVGR